MADETLYGFDERQINDLRRIFRQLLAESQPHREKTPRRRFPSWVPRLAKAVDGILLNHTGDVQFYDGKPDDPGDEEESDEDTVRVFNRFGDVTEDDWLIVGFVAGNWEIIHAIGGDSICRGVLLDDLTASNSVSAAATDAGGVDTGSTLEPVYSGLPSISILYAGTTVWMKKAGGGYSVFAHDCPDSTGSLEFTVQPTDVVHGSGTITPAVKVQVLDGLGNLLTGSSVPVTLAVKGVDAMQVSGQRLTGTLTRTPVNGIVTFDDIRVVQVQNSVRLQARAINFGSVTSDGIHVT